MNAVLNLETFKQRNSPEKRARDRVAQQLRDRKVPPQLWNEAIERAARNVRNNRVNVGEAVRRSIAWATSAIKPFNGAPNDPRPAA